MRRYFILLVAPLFLFACADERATQPTDQPPFSAVQIDGQAFRAAKVSATNQTDLSIELSYAVRGGRAYIDAVTIDGVEYRSDCAGRGQRRAPLPMTASRDRPYPTTHTVKTAKAYAIWILPVIAYATRRRSGKSLGLNMYA